MSNILKIIAEKNRSAALAARGPLETKRAGLYSVCSANEIVIRAAIRRAAAHNYPLIIESTSNQVNQFGGYTGISPREFAACVQKIASEEKMDGQNLILGGDHLGPLVWQKEPEESAMQKAVELIRAYTLAGYSKIHLDTSMKLADDPPGPLEIKTCARRGAVLAKAVYESYAEKCAADAGSGASSSRSEASSTNDQSKRPVLVIGSEVPVPGGSQEHEDSVTPTKAEDFLKQVSVFKDEFAAAGVNFNDAAAFVVQPGVEFGDDFVFFYDSQKAAKLTAALKTAGDAGGLVFEGHSTDYQTPENLAEMVADGIAFLKVGPALTFSLREGLFLLEAVEEILVPSASRSNFRKALLDEMNKSKQYWEKYYSGTADEIEYKKLFSYSDRCRYYLPAKNVQDAVEKLFYNLPEIPPALLSQFFPLQYRRAAAGKLQGIAGNACIASDPLSILCDRIGDLCDDYAFACGFLDRKV